MFPRSCWTAAMKNSIQLRTEKCKTFLKIEDGWILVEPRERDMEKFAN